MRLANKTIVITGSSSGIGEAAAAMCRREGATVIGIDRAAGTHTTVLADTSDEQQVRKAFEQIHALDVLVTCAGIAYRKPAAEQDVEGWDELMRVNVRGTFLCSKYAIPRMPKGGSIMHLSSVVGVTGVRNRAAYSTTKGAIVALTRNMALDYAA